MRGLVLAAACLSVVGCGASSSEEREAYRALQPKPPTEAQKRTLDELKAKFPQGGSPHAGATP